MTYPLAHDENGFPLDVPPTAAGWLVRRHGGGKGRPATIYDADGRPLVVPLEATAEDLRAAGCRPGPHRLDAVDDRRQAIGVVAYTDLPGGDAGDETPTKPAADPAVMALARAVEAMQRVQAERERVQAEMFAKLIERIAPAPSHPGQDLRNALGQAADLKKALDDLAAVHGADGDEDDDGDEEDEPNTKLQKLIITITPMVEQITSTVKAVVANMQSAKTAPRNVAPPTTAAAGGAAGGVAGAADQETGAEGAASPEALAKVDAVLGRLTPEEIELAQQTWQAMPPHLRKMVEQQMLTLDVDDAVARVRALLEQHGHKFARPAAA